MRRSSSSRQGRRRARIYRRQSRLPRSGPWSHLGREVMMWARGG